MKLLSFLLTVSLIFSQSVDEIVSSIENYTDPEKKFFKSNMLSFDWKVKAGGKVVSDRKHKWSIKTGEYEILTKTKDGKELLVNFNINDKKGTVKIDGKLVEDSEKYLKSAYAWYINDSYWLIFPLKLRDKGVNLTKEKMDGDLSCFKMNFDNVGLTPGDQYWIYADKMGEIKRWKFKLEGGNEGDFTWENYEELKNGIKFSSKKSSSKYVIEFENVKIE